MIVLFYSLIAVAQPVQDLGIIAAICVPLVLLLFAAVFLIGIIVGCKCNPSKKATGTLLASYASATYIQTHVINYIIHIDKCLFSTT